ncbi:hypothetical protein GCM10027596_39820 [Nocardioides korecus]
METLLPVGVTAAALVLTYFTCLRPMRRGHCMMMPSRHESVENCAVSDEAARLRAEIAALRGENVDDATADPSPTR